MFIRVNVTSPIQRRLYVRYSVDAPTATLLALFSVALRSVREKSLESSFVLRQKRPPATDFMAAACVARHCLGLQLRLCNVYTEQKKKKKALSSFSAGWRRCWTPAGSKSSSARSIIRALHENRVRRNRGGPGATD